MVKSPAVLVGQKTLVVEDYLLEGAHLTDPLGEGVEEALKLNISFVRLCFRYIPDESYYQLVLVVLRELDPFLLRT